MRYNLEFRKLTFYGLNGLQSIRKLKRISGQTIFSDPQDLEFNPNFAEKRDIPVLKIALHGPSRQRCYDRYTLNILFNVDHMPYSNIQSITSSSNHRLMSTFEFS